MSRSTLSDREQQRHNNFIPNGASDIAFFFKFLQRSTVNGPHLPPLKGKISGYRKDFKSAGHTSP